MVLALRPAFCDFPFPMIFLGIDSGTQSTKTIALDAETGSILASAQQAYSLIDGLDPGHLEQHPADWTAAVDATIGEVLEILAGRSSEVAGIGVSGQQHGLVVLDAEDSVVRPAKLWCDTSTVAQCDRYNAEFGGLEGLVELAGNAMLPGYTIPKLLWLKENEAENFARTTSVLLPHDYLNFHLTGVKRMEYGDASGTGILDVRTRTWSQPLIDFVDPRVSEMLPELGSSRVVHGTLRPELASRWGLGEGVIVSAGGGDNMMGAIGTGNVRPGRVTASFGTSGTLYGVAGNPVCDGKGEVAAFCDSTDQWLPLVCTMNVTVVTEQIRDLLSQDLEAFNEAVESVPAGADGLTFLPYLNGERTPNLPGGSGVLHGMRPDNLSPAHLARAAMEGATLGLAYGLGRFRDLGMSPSEIRLTGGGSQSPVWRQLAADAFDAEVVTLATSEGAALGGAIQAALAAGVSDDYDELCARYVALDESTRCAPREEARDLYREKIESFSKLTSDLAGSGWL